MNGSNGVELSPPSHSSCLSLAFVSFEVVVIRSAVSTLYLYHNHIELCIWHLFIRILLAFNISNTHLQLHALFVGLKIIWHS